MEGTARAGARRGAHATRATLFFQSIDGPRFLSIPRFFTSEIRRPGRESGREAEEARFVVGKLGRVSPCLHDWRARRSHCAETSLFSRLVFSPAHRGTLRGNRLFTATGPSRPVLFFKESIHSCKLFSLPRAKFFTNRRARQLFPGSRGSRSFLRCYTVYMILVTAVFFLDYYSVLGSFLSSSFLNR